MKTGSAIMGTRSDLEELEVISWEPEVTMQSQKSRRDNQKLP